MIEGIQITPLRIIDVPNGDVYHALKQTEQSFVGFGEAYFSTVEKSAIKGWKKHREMTLNLIVSIGAVRFVLFDDRVKSATRGQYQTVVLSRDNYSRLTVPPKIWMAFQGIGDDINMTLNIADILHDPTESDAKKLTDISFDWSI